MKRSQKINLAEIWGGYIVCVQPQELNFAFATPSKHLSKPSLEAPSDRDFTITQGNLFPRLVILRNKKKISNLNFPSCNLSMFPLVLFPRT